MNSNDIIENDCNGQVEKESRKNIAVTNVIKYFNTALHSQDTRSHMTNLININTNTICHCAILHQRQLLCSITLY